MRMAAVLELVHTSILATAPEYPFGGSIRCRAFLIQRAGRPNMFVYGSSHIEKHADEIKSHGRISHQLLNHRDEASKFCNFLPFPVFCHAAEVRAITNKGCKVGETYDGPEHRFGDDLVAYHTPGHTEGATSYLWTPDPSSPQSSVLFTGDTLYGKGDGLLGYTMAFHHYPNQAEDMMKTLQLIKRLKPGVIIPGLTSTEQAVFPFEEQHIDRLIEQLTAGHRSA